MLAPPELRAVHPLGKSPVITDGELTLAESGAILEYLVERYGGGQLMPARGTPERLRYRYWMHYAEGSAMPPLLLKLVFDQVEQGEDALLRQAHRQGHRRQGAQGSFIQPQIDRHLDYLEGELGKTRLVRRPAFSAADVQMSFPVEAAAARGRLDARPAAADGFPGPHPCAAGLPARAGARRACTSMIG